MHGPFKIPGVLGLVAARLKERFNKPAFALGLPRDGSPAAGSARSISGVNLGAAVRAAVEAGYDRATLTILDANVTTLIAAIVLFQFGTGPVKGFAVTLSLGVIASLFTGLILSRIIFDYYLIKRKVKSLSI